MKTQILFYSLSGSTREEAQRLAEELRVGGDEVICDEVKEAWGRSLIGTLLFGCPQAMLRGKSRVMPFEIIDADKYIIGCPIWAGFPAPAFNTIISFIPKGKQVEVFFCSGGGEEPKSKQGTIDMIKNLGLTLVSYRDVKTGGQPVNKD